MFLFNWLLFISEDDKKDDAGEGDDEDEEEEEGAAKDEDDQVGSWMLFQSLMILLLPVLNLLEYEFSILLIIFSRSLGN